MSKNKTLLSETAVKVRFMSKSWGAIVVDKELKREIADNKHAYAGAIGTTLRLCGDAPKHFRKIFNQFRNNQYHRMTLPWDDASQDMSTGKSTSGWRLCPINSLDVLMESFEHHQKEFELELDSFLKHYERYIDQDRKILGDLFDEYKYPCVDDLRDKFRFTMELEQISEYTNTNDIRLKCSESMKKRIEQDAKKRIEQNVNNAMKGTVDGLIDQVNDLVKIFATYDPSQKRKGFFTGKVFNGLKKSLETLPTFNDTVFSSDPKIKHAHQQLVKIIAKTKIDDDLRDGSEVSQVKRETLAKDLAESVDDLQGSFLDKAMK
tara:strand:- start:1601 stop:2560 length:960 start_codon:yes stop_codon:yes gene_type:complete